MGREAECACQWGDEAGHCKVVLEAAEMIVRGGMRRRVPYSAITDVAVWGEELVFEADGLAVRMGLGAAVARRWAEAIAAPPPGLAKKLGITATSRVLLLGKLDELELGAGSCAGEAGATLVLLRASTALELETRLGECWGRIEAGCPVWVVYPKGKASTLGETAVREKMRGLGCIDTKVVSVSAELTGLRFVRRKTE